MADTSIEWTDKVWNPVRGCSRVSPGCDHCYAMGQARRSDVPGGAYEGLTVLRPKGSKRPGVDWKGVARLVPEQLALPLRWRAPKRIFVNSMSDLFHESLTTEQIAAVFGVMAACRQHTFQILTKRPKRAAEFFKALGDDPGDGIVCQAARLMYADNQVAHLSFEHHVEVENWPLPNVHLGVSIETQREWHRWSELARGCPAVVQWVSLEPLLGPVDMLCAGCDGTVRDHQAPDQGGCSGLFPGWVVVGGESGNGARPFDLQWAESLRQQSRAARSAFYMKQMGTGPLGWTRFGSGAERNDVDPNTLIAISAARGKDPSVWPEQLRVREFPQ